MTTIRAVFYVEDFPDLVVDTPVTITIPRNAGRRFAVEIDLPAEVVSQPNYPPTVRATQSSSLLASPRQFIPPLQFIPSPARLPTLLNGESFSNSLSPGEDPFRSRDLTPNSSRTLVGVDGNIDAGHLTSPRSPLLYPPFTGVIMETRSPAQFVPSPLYQSPRQPTLLEAMQERRSPVLSPQLSPEFQYRTNPNSPDRLYLSQSNSRASSLASSDSLSPGNLSAYLPSPQILSGPLPDYRGNTMEYGSFTPSSRFSDRASGNPCLSQYVGGQTYRPSAEELDAIRRNSPEPY